MKKEKEKNPILYEKYKREHHLNEDSDSLDFESSETKKKVIGNIRHAITVIILVIMIFLSAIGTITLLNEELRESCLALILMSM